MFLFKNIPVPFFCTIILLLCYLSGKLWGADRFWDSDGNTSGLGNSNGSWSSGGVWSSTTGGTDAKSWVNGSTAIFSDGSPTITADLANVTIDGITVTGSNAHITIANGSGSLELSSGGSGNFNIAAGSNLTINETLDYQSTGILDKKGKGVLTFGVDNTGSGPISTTLSQGKIDLGSSVNNLVGGIFGFGDDKSMVGGDGQINSLTFGNGDNEIDFVSPGMGLSSSMSSNTSRQQTSAASDARSNGAEAVGLLTITNLTLNGGTIYDWEIADFSPGTADGSKYDVLKYDSISFEDGQKIGINILAISNSTGGPGLYDNVSNLHNSYSTNNGFHFMQSINGSHPTNGPSSAGDASSYFDIYTDSFDYYTDPYLGSWGVWYDGSGDFYLTYSAVPEPSTYVMISTLFLFIGGNRSSRKTMGSIFTNLKNKFSKQEKNLAPIKVN